MKHDPVITVALSRTQIIELIEAARQSGIVSNELQAAKDTLQRVVRPSTQSPANVAKRGTND